MSKYKEAMGLACVPNPKPKQRSISGWTDNFDISPRLYHLIEEGLLGEGPAPSVSIGIEDSTSPDNTTEDTSVTASTADTPQDSTRTRTIRDMMSEEWVRELQRRHSAISDLFHMSSGGW